MVKRSSKRGLNTGNTIRCRDVALHEIQRYGCLMVHNEVRGGDSHAARKVAKDLTNALPNKECGSVELSLNKQRRWELPDYLKSKIEEEADSEDLQVTVIEHSLAIGTYSDIDVRPTCTSYYNNVGRVRMCESNSEMNIKSAKQGHREEDHLSKAQRRLLRKANETTENNEELTLPTYECHIGYGPEINGKLYKDLATKGFTQKRKKNKDSTTGCSKRFLSKNRYRDDYDMYLDDDVCGADTQENTTSEPITASLADFFTATTNPFRSRLSSGNSSGSDEVHSEKKQRLVFVDQPIRSETSAMPAPMSVVQHTKPYTPAYGEVQLRVSDIDMSTLNLNFGDNYTESYCTPRAFSLNLSEELGGDDQFHLMMVLRAEGNDTHKYRVFCTGTHIDAGSAEIPTIGGGAVYDLATLKDLAITHGRMIGSEKRASSPTPRSARLTSAKSSAPQAAGRSGMKWNVTSSFMSELTQQTIGDYHSQSRINLLNQKDSLSDFVFIPTRFQRAISCNIQCGICFDDLNDAVLHSAILPCHHYFCNECWSVHITNSVREGLAHISCPEYECKRQLDPVFIMSMTDYATYSLHEVHLTEFSLFSQRKANWCPKDSCSRLLHCDDELAVKDEPISVKCGCGTECCFRCLDEPHWPLTCSQLTAYHQKLAKDGLKNLAMFTETAELIVSTKPCPKCHMAIEKDGGCVHMSCSRCHTPFCWKCGQPYVGREYYHTCKASELSHTTTEFSYGIPDSTNHHYNEACKHRVYKAPSIKFKFQRCVNQLLSSASVKAVFHFQSQVKQPLRRYLGQVVRQIRATHNLLEYCNAVNIFKKGPKYCVSTCSMLAYHVSTIEREMFSTQCTKKTLDQIIKSYEVLKCNTDKLINQMSSALTYVKPASGVEISN